MKKMLENGKTGVNNVLYLQCLFKRGAGVTSG